MRTRFWSLALILVGSCVGASPGAPPSQGSGDASFNLTSISPATGPIEGGTRITLHGHGLSSTTGVTIGGAPCASPVANGDSLTCVTAAVTVFDAGAVDVVATDGAHRATLAAAFTYECTWATTYGRKSCGAVPPAMAPQLTVTGWMAQTNGATVTTNGLGTIVPLPLASGAAFDFTDKSVQVTLQVDGIAHAHAIDLWLGDPGLVNAFVFHLRANEGQPWLTDGDMVSLSLSWSTANMRIIGAPNRAAITDARFMISDDATGLPITVAANGIAAVAEPVATYPRGVVSWTFDDGWASQADVAAPILAQYGIPATAYIIADVIGVSGRMTLDELNALQAAGWDIAEHAARDADHFARLTSLTPQQIEDDMVDGRAWLIAHGFHGYNHCAYPGGNFDGPANVLPYAGMYFTTCRTIYRQERETFPPADARKLRVLYLTNGWTLAQAEAIVDQAAANREWLIIVNHQLVPGVPASTIEWNTADFAALAAYVAASGMPVKTLTEVMGG